MISGRRARCRPPGRGTARPAARHGLDSAWHRDTDVHLRVRLREGSKEGDLGGRDDGGCTCVGVHGPSGTRLGDECEITVDGRALALGGIGEKVLAAHRRGLGRAPCRWGTAGRRSSTTASGARSLSTTSRRPRSWVDLALHREEVVEPHPEQPRARRQHPRNASSVVSPAASNRTMHTSSKMRVPGREGGIDNTTARSGSSPIPTGFSKMDGS